MKIINIQEEGRFAGPHKRMIEVAQGLKAHGVNTTLIFSGINADILRKKLEATDLDYQLPNLHKLTKEWKHFIAHWILFIPEILTLIKIIKSKKPDLIHVNGSWQWKGLIAAKLTGVPVVWHLSDTFMPWYVKLPFNVIKKYFIKYFIGACQRSVDFYLSTLNNKLVHVVQAPINTTDFNPAVIDKDLTLIPKADGFNIFTVGNIVSVKGYDILLKAIKIVNTKKKNNNFNFFCVGRIWENQKGYHDKLMTFKKENNLDNVHFLGGSNKIKELLKLADMYVCSSRYEASPISVWEALSMSLPVVATDVGDVDVFFKKHQAGIVVPTENPEALAEQIIKMAEDEAKRKVFSENARKTAINEFDLSICVNRHLNCYNNVLKDFQKA